MQRNYEEPKNTATFEEGTFGASGDSVKINCYSSVQQGAPPTSKSSQNTNAESQAQKKEEQNDGEPRTYTSFDDMGLHEGLLRGIYALGFEKPSAIQQRAIVPCCSGCDVIAQSQSGTGKTATFAISLLQQLDLSNIYCQVRNLELTARSKKAMVVTLNVYVIPPHPLSYTHDTPNRL